MSSYIAFLDSANLVTQVVQSPNDGQDWVRIYAERSGCRCIETAIDGSFRNKYACAGFTYYEDIDSFIEPSPFPSWSLNKETKEWEPPVEKPNNNNFYAWNETNQSWDLLYDFAARDV